MANRRSVDTDFTAAVQSLTLTPNSQVSTPEEAKCFERRSAAGKGQGLFATKNIPAGTRLFADPPLLTLGENDETLDALTQKFESLTPAQLSAFTELSHHLQMPATVRKDLRDHLKGRYQAAELKAEVERLFKLHAIFKTNAVFMDDDNGAGVFATYSKLNHSCVPNVQNWYNADLKCMTGHAVRDIREGEELATQYSDVALTQQERQKTLDYWCFKCSCEACSPGEAMIVHEKRRARMQFLGTLLAASESDMDVLVRSIQTPEKTLNAYEELTALYKEEGLFTMGLARCYHNCSKSALNCGKVFLAKAYARKFLDVERTCIGESTHFMQEKGEGADWWMGFIDKEFEKEQAKLRLAVKKDREGNEEGHQKGCEEG